MLILAGDIGGTTTRLAFFRAVDDRLEIEAARNFASREYGSLTALVKKFVNEQGLTPERACFGIAGPVRDGRVLTPNLPWLVDAAELASLPGMPQVVLINDLEANAHGIPLLADDDLVVLNPGQPDPQGPFAVISAGTGLGEAMAVRDGANFRALPTEGGHADFAPRNELETKLLLYLRDEFGRVSYERVISGPGLRNIYRFLRDSGTLPENPEVAAAISQGDPAAAISRAALAGDCPLCGQALDLFISLYGAEAGNLALRTLATGGIFVGGGIAPKIIDRLKGPAFMLSFTAKGRLSPLLETIPVRVILNDKTALLGAARCALLATA